MLSSRNIAITALALCACADTGTETDNPVIDFEASDCIEPSPDMSIPKIARSRAALTVDPKDYAGLYCYAWEVTADGAVTIDVVNYEGGCAVEFDLAETRVEGDRIDLGIINARCSVAGCDSTCLYDFTYELTGVDTSRPARLQLREVACSAEHEGEVEPRIELPLDTEPEGVLCRQALYLGGAPVCGYPRTPPCGGDYFGTCEDGCRDGVVCTRYEPFDRDMCFAPCRQDRDCSLDIESCQDGVCRLRDTF